MYPDPDNTHAYLKVAILLAIECTSLDKSSNCAFNLGTRYPVGGFGGTGHKRHGFMPSVDADWLDAFFEQTMFAVGVDEELGGIVIHDIKMKRHHFAFIVLDVLKLDVHPRSDFEVGA